MESNIAITEHLKKMSDQKKGNLVNLFSFAKEKGLEFEKMIVATNEKIKEEKRLAEKSGKKILEFDDLKNFKTTPATLRNAL